MELNTFRYPNLLSAILGENFSIRFQPHQAVLYQFFLEGCVLHQGKYPPRAMKFDFYAWLRILARSFFFDLLPVNYTQCGGQSIIHFLYGKFSILLHKNFVDFQDIRRDFAWSRDVWNCGNFLMRFTKKVFPTQFPHRNSIL